VRIFFMTNFLILTSVLDMLICRKILKDCDYTISSYCITNDYTELFYSCRVSDIVVNARALEVA
jgi:hypothetical protein